MHLVTMESNGVRFIAPAQPKLFVHQLMRNRYTCKSYWNQSALLNGSFTKM